MANLYIHLLITAPINLLVQTIVVLHLLDLDMQPSRLLGPSNKASGSLNITATGLSQRVLQEPFISVDSSNTPIHVQFKIDGVSPWMDANDSFSPGIAEVDGVTAVDASKTTNHLQKTCISRLLYGCYCICQNWSSSRINSTNYKCRCKLLINIENDR